MRSHRSRNSGAGGLCEVRMAFAPIALSDLEPALPHPLRHGGADGAAVVVQVDAVHLDVPAVEQEAAVRVVGDGADAEGRRDRVGDARAVQHLGAERVEVRRLHRPEPRRGDLQPLLQLRRSAPAASANGGLRARDLAARAVEHHGAERRPGAAAASSFSTRVRTTTSAPAESARGVVT